MEPADRTAQSCCGPVSARFRVWPGFVRGPWARSSRGHDDDFWLEIIGFEASNRANTECMGECRIGGLPPSCELRRWLRLAWMDGPMSTQTHDFVTVDMRGLKAALTARAQAQRVSVSVLVRRAVERELGQGDLMAQPAGAIRIPALVGSIVKLSIRLTNAEVAKLDAGAQRASLSRGAFIAGLMAQMPILLGGTASRLDCIAALTASNAELATLSRNLHHLTLLLRQGDVQAAKQYRQRLDTLGDEVRAHLRLAAGVLADLRPAPSNQSAAQGSVT
jgi:hypothetical protein